MRLSVAQGASAPAAASDAEPFCTYTTEPGPNETTSVNCIDRSTAEQACAAQDKRLPSEAEWQYAAGGRSVESPYPWTLSNPTNEGICAVAVVARGDNDIPNASRLCILNEPALEPGPAPGGSASDVTASGLRNLGGNLSEWAADDFARYSDSICWGADLGLRDDPRCAADPTKGVLRGGNWASIPYNTHVYFRQGAGRGVEEPMVGVRCARSAQ
jgi:formylglycine-generating enzyme required for sulfatase activity